VKVTSLSKIMLVMSKKCRLALFSLLTISLMTTFHLVDRTEFFKTIVKDLYTAQEDSIHIGMKRISDIDVTKQHEKMNILLLYADDWRYDTLGAAGNSIVKTPILDALASRGVRFTENCVTTSICHVSRASLYSGQYLARHRFERMKVGRFITVNGTQVATGFEVPHNETLYSLLKFKAGYYVGHVGKFGLRRLFNREQFDSIIVDWGWHWKVLGGKLWHITEKNTHDALHFLTNRDKSKPFFLNVAYFATHAVDGDSRQYMPQNTSMLMYENVDIPIPVTSTQEAWEKMPYFFTDKNEGRTRWKWRFDTPDKHQSMMKNYYRMASEVDTSVGIILNQLAQEEQLNNTLIIFTTDNGNFHSEHGLADKWYPHQESIRVPLIINDPRMSDEYRGTVNDDFTLNIDLTTTIVSAAGIAPLSTMMGRDMSKLYRKGGFDLDEESSDKQRMFPIPASDGNGIYHSGSESSWRTEFFYEYPIHSNHIPASEALVRKDYKYFYWPHYKHEQLFDMKNDPVEMNDLVNSTDPSIQQKLKDMRKRFNELKSIVHSNASIIL